MQVIVRICIFFVLAFVVPISAFSEDENDLRSEIIQREQQLVELGEKLTQLSEERRNGRENAILRFYKAEEDYYEYENKLRMQTLAVLRWQLAASYVVLALVVIVTGLGVVLAYKEVQQAIKIGQSNESSMTLEARKIQITSAVTGVVILVLSLFFLFLFLEKVYQLDPISLGRSDAVTTEVGSEQNVSPPKNH